LLGIVSEEELMSICWVYCSVNVVCLVTPMYWLSLEYPFNVMGCPVYGYVWFSLNKTNT